MTLSVLNQGSANVHQFHGQTLHKNGFLGSSSSLNIRSNLSMEENKSKQTHPSPKKKLHHFLIGFEDSLASNIFMVLGFHFQCDDRITQHISLNTVNQDPFWC